MKRALSLILTLCCCFMATAWAQDVQTKGSIGGTVVDQNGAVIPGAKVSVTGPTGERSLVTNGDGLFALENLIPGTYIVKVTQPGFKSAVANNVTVNVGKQATLQVQLETGDVAATVEVTSGTDIDLASTAVGQNLNDQLYNNIPVARSVTSLFYLSPGANDSLGGGTANPSISGGSALDNLYIADGVNITDSAFGGLGTFSRSYGSLGTGINTSYIKEVQVKTGGFEPQYGQSQGGIINIITKSGGSEFHGALYGYARPKSFEATRLFRDEFNINKGGKVLHPENYDVGADFSGPLVKDHLFFFGSFNPTINRNVVLGAARNAKQIAAGTGTDSGLFRLIGQHTQRTRSLNYAFKLDYNINQNHQINFSIFGDPSETNTSSFSSLNIDNTTAFSKLSFGTRSTALRYNGVLGSGSSPLTIGVSFSQGRNHFGEAGFANIYQIVDRTQTTLATQRGQFVAAGRGFIEPTNGTTYRTEINLSKQVSFWGTHTLGVGYQFQRGLYSGIRDRSGPKFPVPQANASGTPLAALVGAGGAALTVGQSLNGAFSLRLQAASCLLCPLLLVPGDPTVSVFNGVSVTGYRRVSLQQTRGEFGVPAFDTYNNYHAGYVQDTWRFNKYLSVLLGLRMEQERIVGNPGSDGKRIGYSFTDQWAPRLGATVDPFGKGKTKVYYNFGRFFEYIPLDLAERSLSSEKDFTGGRFAPEFTMPTTGTFAGQRVAVINALGTVNPVLTAASLLSGATGGVGNGLAISASDPSNPILPGTKLGFAQEHIIGFEQQLPKNLVLQVRYLDRRLKRIVEDAAVVPPEGASFFGQTYFIGNISKTLDAAVNPILLTYSGATAPARCLIGTDIAYPVSATQCFAVLGANGKPAGDPGADGVPDGFPKVVHNYRAVEIELNKRFADGWQLLTNYRIASLRGNFEGHFRNDNGQTDPAISSLFDFTAGDLNLLGDQFAVGPINTDRRFVSNIYGSYAFSKDRGFNFVNGLNLGLGLHMESGVPLSAFGAHPVYLNAGEIPLGGRGALGRSKFFSQVDMHIDYPWAISERVKLSFIGDLFNLF